MWNIGRLMSDLPATLTYFDSFQSIGKILTKSALPLLEAHHLNDPFLPNKTTPMDFNARELFEASIKYIVSSILGKIRPRGQPNHPLQKAILRWRMENRFTDESEIRAALQGLLPAMVEQSFNEAKVSHQAWVDFVSSKKMVILYEKYSDIMLWETRGLQHKGAAIKFKCTEDSLFQRCRAVVYKNIPATTVCQKAYVEHMVGVLNEIEFDPLETILTQNNFHRKFKEWRLLIDAAMFEDEWAYFPMSMVQSVYLGALVPDKTVEQFKGFLGKIAPDAVLFHAQCKTNHYEIGFERISESAIDGVTS